MHTLHAPQIPHARLAPLRPLVGGEGGARRGSAGRVRWVARLFRTLGSPHLTPILSAPKGGERDILAVRSVHALALSRGRRYPADNTRFISGPTLGSDPRSQGSRETAPMSTSAIRVVASVVAVAILAFPAVHALPDPAPASAAEAP